MSENAIALLTTDHREVEEMFGKLDAGSQPAQERKDLADQVAIELIRHSIAEEEYLYPTVKDVVPGGEQLADREIEEHGKVAKTLKTLDGLSADNVDFDATLRTLMSQVRKHITEEEGELFPKLRQATNEAQLAELGDKLAMAKKAAPTRPHPSAPSEPPMNKLLGPGAGLVDRLRDKLSGRGART